jgi:hypothetical protein
LAPFDAKESIEIGFIDVDNAKAVDLVVTRFLLDHHIDDCLPAVEGKPMADGIEMPPVGAGLELGNRRNISFVVAARSSRARACSALILSLLTNVAALSAWCWSFSWAAFLKRLRTSRRASFRSEVAERGY